MAAATAVDEVGRRRARGTVVLAVLTWVFSAPLIALAVYVLVASRLEDAADDTWGNGLASFLALFIGVPGAVPAVLAGVAVTYRHAPVWARMLAVVGLVIAAAAFALFAVWAALLYSSNGS